VSRLEFRDPGGLDCSAADASRLAYTGKELVERLSFHFNSSGQHVQVRIWGCRSFCELTSRQRLTWRDGPRDLQPIRTRGERRENKEIQGNAGIARLELRNTRLARLEPMSKGLLREAGAHSPGTNMPCKRGPHFNELGFRLGKTEKLRCGSDSPAGGLDAPSLTCVHDSFLSCGSVVCAQPAFAIGDHPIRRCPCRLPKYCEYNHGV
jgi:hypothetical protein